MTAKAPAPVDRYPLLPVVVCKIPTPTPFCYDNKGEAVDRWVREHGAMPTRACTTGFGLWWCYEEVEG